MAAVWVEIKGGDGDNKPETEADKVSRPITVKSANILYAAGNG